MPGEACGFRTGASCEALSRRTRGAGSLWAVRINRRFLAFDLAHVIFLPLAVIVIFLGTDSDPGAAEREHDR